MKAAGFFAFILSTKKLIFHRLFIKEIPRKQSLEPVKNKKYQKVQLCIDIKFKKFIHSDKNQHFVVNRFTTFF